MKMRNLKHRIRISYKLWILERRNKKLFKKWEREFDAQINSPMEPPSYHEMRKERFKDFNSGPFTEWEKKEKENAKP